MSTKAASLYAAAQRVLLATLLLLSPGQSCAEEILVATASNFRQAMAELAHQFEQASGHRITPIFGSTGKHFAQIVNGAPFDAFFAADAKRPIQLEEQGLSVPDSRFTYAIGRLVLWSPNAELVDPQGQVLKQQDFNRLAIANPRLAPYGLAARQTLENLGLWQRLEARLVRGENIAQAFLFVRSGNADLGLVAWSQIKNQGEPVEGSFWRVPEELYAPIEQQAVLLKDNDATRSFMAFIRSSKAAKIIQNHGYATAARQSPDVE
jgi:molybdate transport system substrate-binding protein